MAEPVTRQLQQEIERLGPRQRRQLLEIARALSRTSLRGMAGRGLARFAGTIPSGDLQVMQAEIAAGCEQVRADDW